MRRKKHSEFFPSVRIKLDWKAYFERFCEEHGEPVEHDGRLLFPDGWTYSATDYQGPERPPPDDPAEVSRLLRSYWSVRRDEVKKQLLALDVQLTDLDDLQRHKSLPLQRKTEEMDYGGEVPKVLFGSEEVSMTLGIMRERLAWLKEELALCENKMSEAREVEHETPSA